MGLNETIKVTDEIVITLASPLAVPYLDEFIVNLLGQDYAFKYRYRCAPRKIEFDEYSGKKHIPDKDRYGGMHLRNTKTYGTSRMSALAILEHLINNRPIMVYDNKWNGERSINEKETHLANEKAKVIADKFERWIFENLKRKNELKEAFFEKYNITKKCSFDGSALAFPEMAENFELRPYQKDAVAAILENGKSIDSRNKILCHTVGAGKTAIVIAACMKLKQAHKSEKNLIIVPKDILNQWSTMFKSIYPNANVLVIAPSDFTPSKRNKVLQQIRDTDSDAVIMSKSSFDMIALSKQFLINETEQKIKDLNNKQAKIIASGKRPSSKLMKDRRKLSDVLVKISAKEQSNAICFDELGITKLFVDESQSYKNLPLASSLKVKGFSGAGSKKCADMLRKARCVQTNGGGVVFATGTPLNNSLAELFVLQTYLQPELLIKTGNEDFDTWVSNFAEITEDLEIDVTTSKFVPTRRLSKFNNLKLLTEQFSQVAIFHDYQLDNSELPEFDGYEDIIIKKTKALARYLEYISERATKVKAGEVPRSTDNMLKITTDGRKAALDIRLASPFGTFHIESKAYYCASKVAEIYYETKKDKLTQVVFCDLGTPKTTFNMYDELKRLLANEGVIEEEIAFIHDYTTDAKKKKLFEDINSGKIRIVIGSSSKLGTGVNIQSRLVAAHHLDVPWRPSDLIQREGRIIRQGNINKKVRIFRYITEGSFDAYSWQIIEAKARFIAEFTSGQNDINTASDIDETVLSYAEVKALAIGNPFIKTRVEKQNELNRLLMLRAKEREEIAVLKDNLRQMEESYKQISEKKSRLTSDYSIVKENPRPKKASPERNELKNALFEAVGTYIAQPEARVATSYRGFDLVLPSNRQEGETPYIIVSGKEQYNVELGESPKGVLVRIDNAIDGIGDTLNKLQNRKNSLTNEIRDARLSINAYEEDKFNIEIDKLRLIISEIDEQIKNNSN